MKNVVSFHIGDGTVASMWSLFDVQFLKDGVGFGLPDVLKTIQPEAKFFIILRDPVERYKPCNKLKVKQSLTYKIDSVLFIFNVIDII